MIQKQIATKHTITIAFFLMGLFGFSQTDEEHSPKHEKIQKEARFFSLLAFELQF